MRLAVFFAVALGAGISSGATSPNISGVWVADALTETIRTVVRDGRQFTIVEVNKGDGSTSITRHQCLLATEKQRNSRDGAAPSHTFVMQCTGRREEWTLSDRGSQLTIKLVNSDLSSGPLLVLRRSNTRLQ